MQPQDQHQGKSSPLQAAESHVQLLETALEQHDATPSVPDKTFAESMIRAEAAQKFERAMATTTNCSGNASMKISKHGESEPQPSSDSALTRLPNLYRPDASSSMRPIQRFAVLSSANDPMPWEARRVMIEAGLIEGSLETLQIRVEAAVSSVADTVVPRRSSMAQAVLGGSA